MTIIFDGRIEGEHNDCVVRAFSIASGKKYGKVHSLLKKYGRKDKRGTPQSASRLAASDLRLKRFRCRMTLSRFLDDFQYVPRCVACYRGHMAGIQNGVITSDGVLTNSGGRIVVSYYIHESLV